MSHVVSVDVIVHDLQALKTACKVLGLEFKESQKTHRWYGRWVNDYSRPNAAYIQSGIDPMKYGNCEHAIEVPWSQYDIGVYHNPKGKGFVLAYDNYGTGRTIAKYLGSGLEGLKQQYAACKAQLVARAKGWSTQTHTLPNGTIKLVFTGAGL